VNKKLLFVVNVDWFFLSHRLPIALEARQNGYEVHIATGVTDKLCELESYGFEVHQLSLMRGGIGPLNALKVLYEIRRIFIEIQPDLVHLVTIKPVILGGIMARWQRVPAVVSAVSGLGYVFTAIGLFAKVRRWAVASMYSYALGHHNQTVIFQNADDCRAMVSSAGASYSNSVIIRGSGVNLDQFSPTPEPSGVPVVLLPARLLKDKGVFEFVQVARVFRTNGVSARFVLAGMVDMGNPTSLSQELLDEWVFERVVEHWGYRTDMPQVISNSNVVVLPSYREGLPKVLLEAAASGRAVVTSDVPGCRDAIVPGLTGLLVPVRDANSLAQAIAQLLEHPDQRLAMGLAGRKLAEEEFDVRAVVARHLELYEQLLDRISIR
jgi:glycosyltransferase involved in cell wall biosynthesis